MNKVYQWQGATQQGLRTSGLESAPDRKKLYKILRDNNIVVFNIEIKYRFEFTSSRKISTKKIAEWTRQIGILLQANIELVHALELTSEKHNDFFFKNGITHIKNLIMQGLSFADSLQKYPQFFNTIYCSIVQAGEKSGTLATMLLQLADYLEQMLDLRNKIIKSLFYPAIVAVVAFIVTMGLLLFVVPEFKNIFANFNAPLPAFTQWVLAISNLVKNQTKSFLCFFILTLLSYRLFYCYMEQFRSWHDGILFKIPLLNHLFMTSITARWTRVLATLLAAGLTLNAALQIVATTVSNRQVRANILQIISAVTAGKSFHRALADQNFPQDMVQMLTVGENAGKLTFMLEKIADMHLAALKHWLDYLSKWLEPLMMLMLALIMGTLIIAMYLPVFQLGSIM